MDSDTKIIKVPTFQYHCFLDEAGDTTFYGKGKTPLIGADGVSNYFILGMLTINEPIHEVREKIIQLQTTIANDPYLLEVPSIQKKKSKMGYFLHAKDDVPEVRKLGFELIKSIDCHFDAVVGRKDYNVYEKKHNGNQAEFYADMLSHLLHTSINGFDKLVLNIAHRSRCTTHTNLEKGLQKAVAIAKHKYPEACNCCEMVFNVQKPTTEPIINIADYFLWALQRKIERGENRYVDFLDTKINSVINLYTNEENKK
ncbi:hypothetical protein EOJ36_02975 [Sandaracinomonas limnophila]|uniref:DUF3800 domain-containing protein n=1 Tax=Sandaracinomonas limnophila TaxID=1862386 RepID=A0A437PXH6_9BACT|nr:DUF3800 domain-containing protein [Sandaracinomonas limnophila]RVU26976.1 hypothetical protein EOJ36_02975 [Sandaracinomonas limnophila]